MLLSLMASVLPWKAQGSQVELELVNKQPAGVGLSQDQLLQRPARGPALLLRHPRHQFWPDGLSLYNQKGIDASRLLEAGQITNSYLLERDQDFRTIQESLGHQDVLTTMIYTHQLNRGPCGVRSPFDLL